MKNYLLSFLLVLATVISGTAQKSIATDLLKTKDLFILKASQIYGHRLVSNATAGRTITIPDSDGTLALTSDVTPLSTAIGTLSSLNTSTKSDLVTAINEVKVIADAGGVADNGVTNAKLTDVPTSTIKGRITAGTGDPQDLTPSQVKTILSLTKTDVGLPLVDNTADASKPVSTPQATAIALKQDAATAATLAGTQTLLNKTLTAPVITSPTGIVKADVGLPNVDNTSDASKPVSTAQATAIALKQDAATAVTLTGAQTVDAKTLTTNIIDGDLNTLSNLKVSQFKAGETVTFDPDSKQDALVSGGNIKSVNNFSLVGSGNVTIDSLPNVRVRPARPSGTDNFWISSVDSRLHYRVNGWEYILQGASIDSIADYTPQNLMRASEQMETGFWDWGLFTFTANNVVAPNAATTAETITTASTFQPFPGVATVVPGQTYTFSAWYKNGTMATYNGLAVTDLTHSNATIVASRRIDTEANGSTWTRLSVGFTAPAGCTTVYCYLLQTLADTGTVFIWGAQLNEGPLRPYTQVVDDAIVP